VIEIFILSLIQGVTEFIPISSSSHLIILSKFYNFDNQNLSIDVSLHIGSFIAVITYFYKDIKNLLENKDLLLKILLGSLPVMVLGFFLLQNNYIEKFRNIEVIGWSTLIFGIMLYISDKFDLKKNINVHFNFKSAIFIGIFQMISLIPGVSRSGISITAARFLNFKRFDAAKISFLLSIPTLGAVSIYGFKNIYFSNNGTTTNLSIMAILLSFVFSLITIKFFLKYIQKFNLSIFVFYRIILGLSLLIINYL
tara:strand:- start:139 stop:897 length:759 start_codon:yes stop_codon:yes gene_type:complete